jgi:hypothetical protein
MMLNQVATDQAARECFPQSSHPGILSSSQARSYWNKAGIPPVCQNNTFEFLGILPFLS